MKITLQDIETEMKELALSLKGGSNTLEDMTPEVVAAIFLNFLHLKSDKLIKRQAGNNALKDRQPIRSIQKEAYRKIKTKTEINFRKILKLKQAENLKTKPII